MEEKISPTLYFVLLEGVLASTNFIGYSNSMYTARMIDYRLPSVSWIEAFAIITKDV